MEDPGAGAAVGASCRVASRDGLGCTSGATAGAARLHAGTITKSANAVDHQSFMLETELADSTSSLTEERGLGWMTDAQWNDLYDQLLEFEALPQPFDYSTAYTNRFLRAVYDGTKLRWP